MSWNLATLLPLRALGAAGMLILAAAAHANPIVDPRIRELEVVSARMETHADSALDRRFAELLEGLGFRWLSPATVARMKAAPARYLPLVLATQRPGRTLEWPAQSYCRVYGDDATRRTMLGLLHARLQPGAEPAELVTAAQMVAAWRDTSACAPIERLLAATPEPYYRHGLELALNRLRGRGCEGAWVAPDGHGGVVLCSGAPKTLTVVWQGHAHPGEIKMLSDTERERLWGAMRGARECALFGGVTQFLLTVGSQEFDSVILGRLPDGGYTIGSGFEPRLAVRGERLDQVLRAIAEARGDSTTFHTTR